VLGVRAAEHQPLRALEAEPISRTLDCIAQSVSGSNFRSFGGIVLSKSDALRSKAREHLIDEVPPSFL